MLFTKDVLNSKSLSEINEKMKSIIHTPTNNLQNSLDFYSKLNYQIISEQNPTFVTDGKVIIEINPDRFARAGLKLFKDSWSNEIKVLEKLASIYNIENGHLVRELNGVWVYLIEGNLDIKFNISENHFGNTGNFSGLSIETTEMAKSAYFWGALGYTKTHGSVEQGWITLSNNDEMVVSLMKPLSCPHLFFNPSMTFFNGKDNLSYIKKIREANIPIAEEITHFNKKGIVDNIIIRDPGGYGFFIFND
jgi:hypothetical protein